MVAAALVAPCVVAAACGEDPAARRARPATVAAPPSGEQAPAPTAYYGQWTLTEGHGPRGEVPLVDGYRISLFIRDHPGPRKAALLAGTAACNDYSGRDDLNDGAVMWKDGFGATEMGCARPVLESETAYFDALLAVDAIARDGDTLVLSGDDAHLRFESVEAAPIERIVGRTWRLAALLDGSEEVPVVGEPGWLKMHRNGKVSGSSGCHGLYGKWDHAGDEILFWEFGVRDWHCRAPLRQQHEFIVGVLGDGFRAELRGTTLTVTAPAHLGLRYELAD